MIKKLTLEEIELLKTQIYDLKKKIVECVQKKQKIDEESLKTEFKFLYKNSKDLFTTILRDFSHAHDHDNMHKKFDKLIDILIKSLMDFNLHDTTHYQASKKYEKDFRQELWPENLKDKFDQ